MGAGAMVEWFYEKGGKRLGPVLVDNMKAHFENGEITENTLVWNSSFGSEWRKFGEAGVVPSNGGPPPLPARYINSSFAWLFALVPLIGLAAERVVADSMPDLGGSDRPVFLAYAAAYIVLGYLDSRQVEKSGRNKKSISIGWLVWFAPGYLFQRARAIGQSQILLGVWLVSFVAAFLISSPEILKGDFYLGIGLPRCDSSASLRQIGDLVDRIYKPSDVTSTSITGPKEITFANNVRVCEASSMLSSGKTVQVPYTISEQKDGYYFQAQIQQ